MSRNYRKPSARGIARLGADCDQTEAAARDALVKLTRRYAGRTRAERVEFLMAVVWYGQLAHNAQAACDELFIAEHGFHPSENQGYSA